MQRGPHTAPGYYHDEEKTAGAGRTPRATAVFMIPKGFTPENGAKVFAIMEIASRMAAQ